jgi:hypothetical protein
MTRIWVWQGLPPIAIRSPLDIPQAFWFWFGRTSGVAVRLVYILDLSIFTNLPVCGRLIKETPFHSDGVRDASLLI